MVQSETEVDRYALYYSRSCGYIADIDDSDETSSSDDDDDDDDDIIEEEYPQHWSRYPHVQKYQESCVVPTSHSPYPPLYYSNARYHPQHEVSNLDWRGLTQSLQSHFFDTAADTSAKEKTGPPARDPETPPCDTPPPPHTPPFPIMGEAPYLTPLIFPSPTVVRLEDAVSLTQVPRVVIEAQFPHRVVHANAAYYLYEGFVQNGVVIHPALGDVQSVALSLFKYQPLNLYPVQGDSEFHIMFYLVEPRETGGNESSERPSKAVG